MRLLVPLLAVALAVPAWAAETGSVRGKVNLRGAPKKDDAAGVVVYLTGFEEPPPAEVPELRQRGRQFQPPILAVTAGQSVAFPNGDPFFHNVFSLSPSRKFDLGQFKNGESKEKAFPKPGIVEVYCNIHPEMAATILVLPNRRHTVTAADGSFTLDGVPAGTWTLFAYHRLAERPARLSVTVVAGQPTAGLVLDVDVDPKRAGPHTNKYGEAYGGAPAPAPASSDYGSP